MSTTDLTIPARQPGEIRIKPSTDGPLQGNGITIKEPDGPGLILVTPLECDFLSFEPPRRPWRERLRAAPRLALISVHAFGRTLRRLAGLFGTVFSEERVMLSVARNRHMDMALQVTGHPVENWHGKSGVIEPPKTAPASPTDALSIPAVIK